MALGIGTVFDRFQSPATKASVGTAPETESSSPDLYSDPTWMPPLTLWASFFPFCSVAKLDETADSHKPSFRGYYRISFSLGKSHL